MSEKDYRNLKVAVVGAGAIGGICAVFIKKAGFNVQVVVRNREHAAQIRHKGITVSGIKGRITMKMDSVAGIENMVDDCDVILLCVKAVSMTEAAKKLKSRLKPETLVVSLQNGFCEQRLASILGRRNVTGCVTGWGATMHSLLELEMTSLGDFIIGSIDNEEDLRLKGVQAVLSSIVPVKISTNITGDLFAKLIINSCITSVGAVCGLCLGPMLLKRKIRLVFLKIMEEAMQVANVLGIRVAVFADKLDYYKFLEPEGLVADLKRHAFLLALGFKYRKLKSSALQSLERAKPTEIDYLTGFITENAEKYGIDVPVNAAVYNMVKDIEQGILDICVDNIDKIFVS
jgi:2-dehydropantoate 2-reductase